MALLAYEEPEKSPMFHLLGLEYRQRVVDSLNRAILGVFFLGSHFNVCCNFTQFNWFLLSYNSQ